MPINNMSTLGSEHEAYPISFSAIHLSEGKIMNYDRELKHNMNVQIYMAIS